MIESGVFNCAVQTPLPASVLTFLHKLKQTALVWKHSWETYVPSASSWNFIFQGLRGQGWGRFELG